MTWSHFFNTFFIYKKMRPCRRRSIHFFASVWVFVLASVSRPACLVRALDSSASISKGLLWEYRWLCVYSSVEGAEYVLRCINCVSVNDTFKPVSIVTRTLCLLWRVGVCATTPLQRALCIMHSCIFCYSYTVLSLEGTGCNDPSLEGPVYHSHPYLSLLVHCALQ